MNFKDFNYHAAFACQWNTIEVLTLWPEFKVFINKNNNIRLSLLKAFIFLKRVIIPE